MRQERKQFFFEKKNQKTFVSFSTGRVAAVARTTRAEVFCFFFSKKKYFLSSYPATSRVHTRLRGRPVLTP
jgi:hypothetical protein